MAKVLTLALLLLPFAYPFTVQEIDETFPSTWESFRLYTGSNLLALGLGSNSTPEEAKLHILFQKFVSLFEKEYTEDEVLVRFENFKLNYLDLLQHNADSEASFSMGINEFSDMTPDEFNSAYGMKPMHDQPFRGIGIGLAGSEPDEPPAPPMSDTNGDNCYGNLDYCDWRELGKVTEVKNQGSCGSCWAFATAATIESNNAIYGMQEPRLVSESHLVDCVDTTYGGCNGGWPHDAYNYIARFGGVASSKSYPYKAEKNDCGKRSKHGGKVYKTQSAGVSCGNWYPIIKKDEEKLKDIVSRFGPVTAGIDATLSSWRSYRGGVYDDDKCSELTFNHVVTVVGFGHDESEGKDYWIVKNSWGSSWGEDGYMRIAYGSNRCGIAERVETTKIC